MSKVSPQLALEFDSRAAMSGQDFMVSACNETAVGWLDHWGQWPSPFLVIYGEKGCGKTHLASVFQAATGARSLTELSDDPYEVFAGHRVVILENAQKIAEETPKALFHLYNYAKENGCSVLLTARTAPKQWQISLADLKSRLGAAAVAAIAPPDEALLSALIVKLFADRQVIIDHDVVDFMVRRLPRSFEAVQFCVETVDKAALAQKRKITVPLVRNTLNAHSRATS